MGNQKFVLFTNLDVLLDPLDLCTILVHRHEDVLQGQQPKQGIDFGTDILPDLFADFI